MKNRKLLLIVSLILAMTMAMGGTLAYLTDTDEVVNVMTLGNVDIEQYEKDAEGNPFVQSQPLYPAYEDGADIVGKIEKVVTVENTGSSDAYVRTWMAFEAGNVTELTKFRELIKAEFGFAEEDIHWQGTPVQIEDQKYFVAYIVYPEAVEPGETTDASLKSVYMASTAGNADVAQFGDTYEILVFSEAVQTKNMETIGAEKALEAAFGTDHPWQDGVSGLPTKTVKTADELAAALAEGGIVVLADDIVVEETITVPSGATATLMLAGHSITQTKACDKSYEMIANNGNLTITGNGTISFTDTGAGDPNFGWGSYTVRNSGTLVVEDATIEHLGTQAFATHAIMPIFQYSGSTTINSGTISCPNYRSVRLWGGDMTINGGTFDGQVWLQAANENLKSNMTINGGSFSPNGGDGSSVFVGNGQGDISFAVTGGNFETKIGCTNADALAGCITGGTFTDAAKANTNPVLFAE